MSSAGQALGGVVGAVIGFVAGGPTGALYGAQIGMTVGGYIDPPKGPNQQGPRLADLTVQSSTYGMPIPRDYGTIAHAGTLIWLEGGRLKEHSKTTRKKSGKGGGGGSVSTTTYTYSATFAVALCEGPIVGIRRLWIGSRLVYDAGASDAASIIASNASVSGWRLHTGTDTQAPDPRIQAEHGVGTTPAWPGIAYLVFDDLDLTEHYSNSLLGAHVKAEIVATGTPVSRYVQATSDTGWGASRVDYGLIEFAGRMLAIGGSVGPVGGLGGTLLYGDIWQSADAVHWSVYEDPGIYRAGAGCVVYNDRLWLLGGVYAPDSATTAWVVSDVISSGDGRNWGAPMFAPWTPRIKPMVCAHDGYLYLAGGLASTTEYADVWRMSGGGLWELVAQDSPWKNGAQGRYGGNLVSLDGYLFVCLGYGNPAFSGQQWQDIWRSADNGVTWTQVCADVGITSLTRVLVDSSVVALDGALWLSAYVTNAGATAYWHEIWRSEDYGVTWVNESLSASPAARSHSQSVVFGGSIMLTGGSGAPDAWVFQYRATPPGATPLADIIEAECLKAGLLQPLDIDVSAITAAVRGFSVNAAGSIRASLETLQAAWPFDVVQAGGKIKFVPRGGASIANIPESDLGARSAGSQAPPRLPIVREMASQLPARVSLIYPDVDREYDSNEQTVERITAESVSEHRLSLAIAFTPDEAAQVADVLLGLYWLERVSFGPFPLPPSYRFLEPADVVSVTHDGAVYQVRLTSVEYTAEGPIICHGKLASAAVYSSSAVGQSGHASPATLALGGPTDLWLLDIPCLGANQDAYGETIAVGGLLSGWRGAAVLRSDDGGTNYAAADGISTSAPVFRATTILGAGRTDIPDAASTLTVSPARVGATLYGCTWEGQLSGANLAALGADGRWEIINFRTVTASGSGYVLSDFGRGLFGTEWAVGTHQVGDLMILLDYDAVAFASLPLAALNAVSLWRAVSNGNTLDSAIDIAQTYRGINLKPLNPVWLTGYRDASGDWHFGWTRRTRYGGQWLDGMDALLFEASEAYEVEIWDSLFTRRKRMLSVTAAVADYTAAQVIADFGSAQIAVGLRVYQMSGKVGRGYPAERVISASADDLAIYTRLILDFPITAGSTAFVDVKGHPLTAVGNVQTSTAVVNTGYGSSAIFDGAGDYIESPASTDWAMAGREKTVEAWIYTGSPGSSMTIAATISRAGAGDTLDAGWEFGMSSGKLRFGFHRGASSSYSSVASTPSIPANTFVHVAVGKTADDVYSLWIDGIPVGTLTQAGIVDNAKPLRIGATNDTGFPNYYNGYIVRRSLRITDAVRYTAPFTPPSLPLDE